MTLTKRVIPCLDVANGRVVKGLHFKSIKDAGDPVLLAEKYSNEGADELVFLDITASEENREIIKSLVSKVAQVINVPFTVGGGVKTLQHARDILLSGADKVAINTGAVKNPKIITELMELFGRQCIVVAVDAKKIRECLDKAPGCKVVDETKDGGYITPVESSGDFVTYISRIRDDQTQKNSINMWVVSDNLLKGAALNAVQIANVLIKKYIN